jgi:ATP-dependent DNA helicase RecQ
LDQERVEHLTRQREAEWAEMKAYLESKSCLMQFLAEALDDELAAPCGRCAVCLGNAVLPTVVEPATLIAAQRFVKHSEMSLELKKEWDISALNEYQAQFGWNKPKIPLTLRGETGRILSRWGEPVWGELVASGKANGRFSDELVSASADLIANRWTRSDAIAWVTCIPSIRHPNLVPDFAQRLAVALGVPFKSAIQKVRDTEPQKNMENRYHQCHNLDGAFTVQIEPEAQGPVLLVDDVVDSAWTLTLAAALLLRAGSSVVFPFALATTASK